MQEAQMLKADIYRMLDDLPLESLKLVAQYIDSLYKNTHCETVLQNNKSTKTDWDSWCAECDKFIEGVLQRRNGEYIDTDAIWEAVKADREERDNRIIGSLLDANTQDCSSIAYRK